MDASRVYFNQDILDELQQSSWKKEWGKNKKSIKSFGVKLLVGLLGGIGAVLSDPGVFFHVFGLMGLLFLCLTLESFLRLFHEDILQYAFFNLKKQKNINDVERYLNGDKKVGHCGGAFDLLGVQCASDLRLLSKSYISRLALDEKVQSIATAAWGEGWEDLPLRFVNKYWLERHVKNLDARVALIQEYADAGLDVLGGQNSVDDFVLILPSTSQNSFKAKT